MIKVNFVPWKEGRPIQKSVLYRINETQVIQIEEVHEKEKTKELVNLEYDLGNQQYGIFAHEYRRPGTIKDGNKAADILACVVDESEKNVYTTICDVKSNISAFSNDLLKDNAMLTAIKEIRDFVEQIHAEILHKNSFLLYYADDGYTEFERIGIVTKHFESEKFLAVAMKLEELFNSTNPKVSKLSELKLKKNLAPYMGEVKRIRDFSNRRVKINNQIYHLQVFLLNKMNDEEYITSIKIMQDDN